MTTQSIQFNVAFSALTGYRPLRWQSRLFNRMALSHIPRVCDLPTGLGKTSVIPIWMIALAQQAQKGSVTLPRRLVYIINRRTVVDQATSIVEDIRNRLRTPDDQRWSEHRATLLFLANTLREIGRCEESELPLAVSTLRGELADNREWKDNPSKPAIVIGTIDMIGSKILFSGYGDSRYWRPQHAGLIGQDSLIIHDESHLTPAFSDLLHQIAEIQKESRELRPIRLMELSATSRVPASDVLKLSIEDEDDHIVRRRLDATKQMRLLYVPVDSGTRQADVRNEVLKAIVEQGKAYKNERCKVLIYVRSPETAKGIIEEMKKKLGKAAEGCTALLTGTIRGQERDELVQTNSVYRAFIDPSVTVDSTVYLISTSAGEVGIDIDADHMVCDSATLDSIIQRLGRVNRRGGRGRRARVTMVLPPRRQSRKNGTSEFEEAVSVTEGILTEWCGESNGIIDVSPRNLYGLLDELNDEQREKAFAPKPSVPPLTDILLDWWSLTSISGQMPGRPGVDSYLHGLVKGDPPETYVVWRKEMTILNNSDADTDTLTEWFDICSIETRERLRDRTDRVQKALKTLLSNHRKQDWSRDFPVLLIDSRGEMQWSLLSAVIESETDLAYRTVVLPVEAGGLSPEGVLDPGVLDPASDVVESTEGKNNDCQRERWLLTRDEDGERYERLTTGASAVSLPDGLEERGRLTLKHSAESAGELDQGEYLILMTPPGQFAFGPDGTTRTRQTLEFHSNQTETQMRYIADSLDLGKEITDALVTAARYHDLGKNRSIWQRFARNNNPFVPLAKSTKYLNGRFLGGYRHEFGSVLEAEAWKMKEHPDKDLILHLIATHHGWGRPHFKRSAWDSTHNTRDNEDVATDIMQRFGRLQRRFGRWGLAWLEALMRCADIAASSSNEGEGI